LFNPKLDVYAFGMVLYEMFSGGQTPLADLKNDEVHLYLNIILAVYINIKRLSF
jgi:hypothetical protein